MPPRCRTAEKMLDPSDSSTPVECPECERLWAELSENEQGRQLQAAEIDTLQQRLTEAQQERVDTVDDYEAQIAVAEALIDPEANGETTIAGMAYAILGLRKELDAAQAETVEVRRQRNEVVRIDAFRAIGNGK